MLLGITPQNRMEVRFHMLKLEHHGKLASVEIGI